MGEGVTEQNHVLVFTCWQELCQINIVAILHSVKLLEDQTLKNFSLSACDSQYFQHQTGMIP